MLPPNEPVMLTAVGAVTERVVTGNVAEMAPAGTVTLAGTVAAVESAESGTIAPPGGAAALNDTVPVAGLPPTTLTVFTVTEERIGPAGPGVTFSVVL